MNCVATYIICGDTWKIYWTDESRKTFSLTKNEELVCFNCDQTYPSFANAEGAILIHYQTESK